MNLFIYPEQNCSSKVHLNNITIINVSVYCDGLVRLLVCGIVCLEVNIAQTPSKDLPPFQQLQTLCSLSDTPEDDSNTCS